MMKNFILVTLSFCALLICGCSTEITPEPDAPEPDLYTMATPTPLPEPPKIIYTDITQDAGINFNHTAGYSGKKFMPETMGAGGGFFDYDQDGNLDIFLVNSRHFVDDGQGDTKSTCSLYRNNGDGTFTDVSTEAGLDIELYGMGCVMADFDGDSDDDLFITAAIDGNRFLINNGDGTFTNKTKQSGLASPTWTDDQGREHAFWSTSAAAFDKDNDGDLDLFVANYIEWSIENDIYTTRDGMGKSFTKPDLYQGQTCLLYENQGDGTFVDVTQESGIYNPNGKSLGVSLFDFNNDHYLDIVVSNDTQPNNLFVNQGDGTFVDEALFAGIGYDENGRARAGMGIDVAYWNHQTPAIAIGNFSHEPVSLYNMENELFFIDAAGRARISSPSLLPLTFGLTFFDFDLDGYLDMALANGHIEPDINKVEKEVRHAQSPQLYYNLKGNRFEEISQHLGDGFTQSIVGRGLAYGDIDNDGDFDLLITSCDGPPRLLRNDNASSLNNFIRLHLTGKSPNTNAIGTVVKLTANEITQTQMVRTGSSYLSQNEFTLTFGLGNVDTIESIEVIWSGGKSQLIDLKLIHLNKTNFLVQE